ncbi:hypothetical protein SUDANB15_02540 [Streptomyces sp. enrichment culture]|uniref:hypothetical protein n=1 Tax=Streptomyces sp. enrichment culture TaxID=1795815 RepID=UPI003F57492A
MTDSYTQEPKAVLFRHKVNGREFEATETSIPSIDFLDAQEEYERVEGSPARPAKSASKKDWVAYAVSQGTDETDAESMTRDELAEAYGEHGAPVGGVPWPTRRNNSSSTI